MDPGTAEDQPLPENMPEILPQQTSPRQDHPRTLKHKKCALDDCRNLLLNFKNGRFCETHLDCSNICGIIPWPSLQVQLQALRETAGEHVVHTFKAKPIYCVQTVQWACGVPIGWGKCYRSESTPQVLSFLNKTWENYPDSQPCFMAYDKACDLLRHIVTQNPDDLWVKSTKFIVDAWHYIGHPPKNGSQPDLVLTEVDNDGVVHQTRAFNTETAEQLNSWLNGFESQLRQMTDVNFDFFIHVLMLIYGETVEKRVVSKERELLAEFWAEVNGNNMDVDI
ncbi:hypothetical protein B0H13DRAFT_2236080 [Mycena leptocephala]|nr:hypothetical protein B0H13DRAFT_2236080 [Mycena leptocephala]